MKIESKTLRQHTAVFTSEDIKAVALPAVARQLGIAEANVASSSADVMSDGSITVVIFEAVPETPVAPSLNSAGMGDAGGPQIPGAGAPQIVVTPSA